MKKLLTILRSDRGAATIEMAFAVPVLAMFLWGIFEIGVIFQANAGMQHALGEGARYATLWPAPSNAAIKQRIEDRVFGVGVGDFDVADPVNGSNYKDLSVTFTMPTNFLFFRGPDIDVTRSKRVYITS
jgi:hypothetical protein